MEDNSKPTEADFQSALLTEFGIDPPAEVVTPPAPAPDDAPVVAEPNKETPVVADDQGEVPTKAEEAVIEPPKPDGVEEKLIEDIEAPKFATKDDVIDAMREYNAESTNRIERLDTAKNQVIDILHPEGIDRNIYDTNNVVIKTAQDIVDRGINNERTGEPFTYEEAASFMLDAQRQMNVNIEELENWAEDVAQKNINLLEGNQQVMAKWGDILKTLPEAQVKELADEYIATQLEFDKTKQYITRMSMTPETYYNRALSPYRTLNTALAEKAAAEEKVVTAAAEAKTADDLAEQNERNGIMPQRGTSAVKSNTGDAYLDALMDELAN